jgi:peptidoglycan endolysin
MATYNDFYNQVIGNAYNIDGAYGAQCLTGDHLVKLADGTYKKAEDIVAGDELSTGNTVISNVAKKAEVFALMTEQSYAYVTDDHRVFLTDGTNKRVDELTSDDEIALDLTNSNNSTKEERDAFIDSLIDESGHLLTDDKEQAIEFQHYAHLNGYSAPLFVRNVYSEDEHAYDVVIERNKRLTNNFCNLAKKGNTVVYTINCDGNHSFYADNQKHHNCWDGAAYYERWLGYPVTNCTNTGYARDVWEQRHSNGILNNFDEVEIMQPGDIAVFAVTDYTPYSHIAIFHSDAGNGGGYFLGQNQGGTPDGQGGSAFNLCWLPYSSTYPTAFRPKAFSGGQTANATPSAPASANGAWIAEDATFTSAYPIRARVDGPSTANRQVYIFPAGSKIHYDAYCHANGYVWIRQPRADGGYWFIPTGESDGSRRTDSAWGSFE